MTEPTQVITAAEVEAEVHTLHVVFQQWFRGELDSLTRVEDALADDFLFISTSGAVVPRAALMAGIEAAAGSRSAPAEFSIEVADVSVAWRHSDVVAATYKEIQHVDGHTTSRQSSVTFAVDSSAPAGLRWLSVHETWLEPPPSPEG